MLPRFNSPRLKFPSGEQRKFIEQVMRKNSIGVKEIASIIGVSSRTVRDWKREKYNITEKAIKKIECSLKSPMLKNIKNLIEKWQIMRSDLNKKGGIACYKKYGDFGTIDGSKKGGAKTLSILRGKGVIPLCKHFSLPKSRSMALAEFVGILLGDGGITKSKATITLNSEADKQYVGYVSNLGSELFGDKPTITNRKDCKATDLHFSGKQLVKYLVDNGLKIGNKVKQQVGVPNWIQNSNPYRIVCLRGLMDTDGCIAVSTHKYKLRHYTYYNPCFANRSKPLLKFVFDSLVKVGLHPSMAGERVWLYNKAELGQYFEIVGSDNFRLLKFKEGIPNGSGNSSLNYIA